MSDFELDFQDGIPDQVKRDIDALDAYGFDPFEAARDAEKQKREEEAKAALLLPQSCMPQYGEVVSVLGIDEQEAIAEIEKIILDAPPSSTICLDFDEEFYIVACEVVLSKLAEHIKSNNIRYVVTEKMRREVMRLHHARQRNRFKGFGSNK